MDMITELEKKLNILRKQIGNTPVVMVEDNLSLKLESESFAGSVKDRAAFYMIEDAIERSLLKENGTIVEGTSGNTGISLCYVAKILELNVVLTMPESMSIERRNLLKELGAELILTPKELGMTGATIKAREIASDTGAYFINQFENTAGVKAHFETTAKEIFENGKVYDYIISPMGSGGTAMGIKRYIITNNLDCKLIVVEPEESPLLSKGISAPHKIQGIGANFLPKIVDKDLIDDIICVKGDDAISAMRDLYHNYGLKCGISSGASYVASKVLKQRVGADKKILAILPDKWDRYPPELYI